MYPKITLPTRIDSREGINNPSTTLVDIIFCSNSDDLDSSVSGVISERISDHQCIFTQARQTRPNSGGVAEGQPRFDKGGGVANFLTFYALKISLFRVFTLSD